jgi:hypothetical protein
MHKDDDPGARTRLQLLRTGLREEGGGVKQEEQGERNELDFHIPCYNLIPSPQD